MDWCVRHYILAKVDVEIRNWQKHILTTFALISFSPHISQYVLCWIYVFPITHTNTASKNFIYHMLRTFNTQPLLLASILYRSKFNFWIEDFLSCPFIYIFDSCIVILIFGNIMLCLHMNDFIGTLYTSLCRCIFFYHGWLSFFKCMCTIAISSNLCKMLPLTYF